LLLKIESLKPKYSIIKPTLYTNTFNMAAVQENKSVEVTATTSSHVFEEDDTWELLHTNALAELDESTTVTSAEDTASLPRRLQITEEPESSIVVKFGTDVFHLQKTYHFYANALGECFVKQICGEFYVLPCDVAMDYPEYLSSDEDWKWASVGVLKSVSIPEDPQLETIDGLFQAGAGWRNMLTDSYVWSEVLSAWVLKDE